MVKINRQEAIRKYPNLPLREWNSKEEEYDFFFPKTFASYILTLPSKSYRGHIKLLGKALKSLTTDFGHDKLIFLGDIDIAWRKRDHDFKPAKEALQFLADNNIGKTFNGALQVETVQLPTFLIQLAWLVRTNAILPYVYFIDPAETFIGTICQYGNLHFSTINATTDKVFKKIILNTKFEIMTDINCYDKFLKASSIKGRRLAT